jgi:Tfp pilus assembly protein PilF
MNQRFEMAWLRAQAWFALALGQREAALRCFDTMLHHCPDHVYALASRAHLNVKLDRLVAATADLERAAQVAPNEAAHTFNLGFVLAKLGQHAAAVAAFERATQANPKLDGAWYGMGLSLLQLQRVDAAITALQRNTELQPMSPYGWTQLARAHVRAAQPALAQKVLTHLEGFEPNVAKALAKELELDART